MLPNNRMTNTFNNILITKFNDRLYRFFCNNEDDYKKELLSSPDMVEIIGEYGQQIKPIFDIDAYNNDIDVKKVIQDIQIIFPNKIVKYAKREPRDTKKGMKYSYRLYVADVRITSKNLKKLIIDNKLNENPVYDMSIYDKNKVLFLPLTTKKVDGFVPPLMPINCSKFDCCASYIEEHYENWDLKFEKPTTEITKINTEDDDDKFNENINKLNETITKLNKKRATDRDSWINGCWCIINLGKRNNI